MIESALSYAEMGWQIFPLHTPDAEGKCSCHKDCDSPGKHPRTLNGVTDATTDEAQITKWWGMWPDANIGVATGARSGFIALDIDPRHGGSDSLKELFERHEPFSEKVWAITGGGGWHVLFKHPGERIGNIQSTPDRPGKLGKGLDVRGDGGYIAVSPSLHASGKRYEWGCEITNNLPSLPEWLRTILLTPAPQTAAAAFDGEIPSGARNSALTSFAGSMRRRGMGEEAIFAALQIENSTRCNPPLPDLDVRKIAHSVARYAPDDPGYIFPQTTPADGDRPDGIYFVSEKSDDLRNLYRQGMTGGVSTGLPALDWNYTVKKKQWTVVTGIPKHGKSAVLNTILHNLAEVHNWRIAVTSIENQPLERHEAELLSIHTGQPFGTGAVPRMSVETMEHAEKWLDEHFVFILPDEGGCTVGGILERVLWVHQNGFPIDGIVIDPWNELEHLRPAGMSETEYVSQCLSRMRRFVRTYDMHLWLVAHPTKLQKEIKSGMYPVPTLYDISGSGNFHNKCDLGISVWRNVLEPNSATEVHVQAVRFRECGRVGKVDLFFDPVSGRFNEQPANYQNYSHKEPTESEINF